MDDLSESYHPISKEWQLRRLTKLKNHSYSHNKREDNKTQEWDKVRSYLKLAFKNFGVTKCEIAFDGCWKNNGLGFAHLDKRRFLSKDDLEKVVLACNFCHYQIEKWPREKMKSFLENIINNRFSK